MRTLLSIFVLLMVWWMKGGSTTETLRQAQGDKLGNRANVETVADRGNRRDACSTGWTQAEACDYRRRQRWQAARLLYNRCGNGGTKRATGETPVQRGIRQGCERAGRPFYEWEALRPQGDVYR